MNSIRAIDDPNSGMYPAIPESIVAARPPKQRSAVAMGVRRPIISARLVMLAIAAASVLPAT
jgi:hypothetical protein